MLILNDMIGGNSLVVCKCQWLLSRLSLNFPNCYIVIQYFIFTKDSNIWTNIVFIFNYNGLDYITKEFSVNVFVYDIKSFV